ncbi:cytochrome P450 [Streptomyces spongiae]|uniref:Cytochrome P450 n=1 Tax=Streptomyces spongiae TaxID=565072 RepID=A0A5N8XAH7_9ACTN|nr:cytochrome P450 [Streptomyces spongiae]MPY56510.1 cytochrome P450 [Streptomyces spongiae]
MRESVGRCPVSHTDYRLATPPAGHYAFLDREREESRFLWNDGADTGFWMLTRYDDVLQGFQNPETFTNDITSALNPQRGIDLLPQRLGGEEHAKLRRVINPYFSPTAVRRMERFAVDRCAELVEELAPRGACDFVARFALRYPTDVFLVSLGLPPSDGEFFVPWVEDVFGGFFGGAQNKARAASDRIMDYFADLVAERRARPLDPREDLVSRLVEARIDEEPMPDRDILTVCMTLLLAGLDTTRSALGYMFWHLARHDEDRRALIADPGLIPAAVEEFIRLYPLVIQAGREVSRQVDIDGLTMEAGDVVWLGIGSANRDPRKFPDPDRFVLGRKGVNQHLGFGAGRHRCLGMHLARVELAIVLREWHARIPDYRIAPDADLVERGGQLTLTSLPLEWDL